MSIGQVGRVTGKALKDDQGRQARVENAAAAIGLQLGTLNLTRTDGSRWVDPELRQWQSGGSGNVGAFSWAS
jgi:hypothetical protein